MSKRPPVRTKENFLVFGSPALEQAEIDEVVACLKSRWIGTGPQEPNPLHARLPYTVLADEAESGILRDDFLMAMTQQGIGVGVHYLSLPEHPYSQERLGWKPEQYPVAARIGRQIVSLPISARLEKQDVADVITAVRRVLEVE